jgi:hypothetical protein
MPTIGFNVETLWYPRYRARARGWPAIFVSTHDFSRLDANITMWDVGGQRKVHVPPLFSWLPRFNNTTHSLHTHTTHEMAASISLAALLERRPAVAGVGGRRKRPRAASRVYASLGYLAGDGPDQFTASSLHLTITLCVCDGACAFSMDAAKQELHRELANNRDAFLLVLANKCDLPNIMPRTWTPRFIHVSAQPRGAMP